MGCASQFLVCFVLLSKMTLHDSTRIRLANIHILHNKELYICLEGGEPAIYLFKANRPMGVFEGHYCVYNDIIFFIKNSAGWNVSCWRKKMVKNTASLRISGVCFCVCILFCLSKKICNPREGKLVEFFSGELFGSRNSSKPRNSSWAALRPAGASHSDNVIICLE